MKKLLTILLFTLPFLATAQHAYISTSGNVILYTGSIERYSSPDIYVHGQYDTFRGIWTATIQIAATGATTDFAKAYQFEFSNATIDALTPAGSTTTQKTKNCVMQAVKNYLSPLNGATTFTLI